MTEDQARAVLASSAAASCLLASEATLLLIVDSGGAIVHANPACHATLGVSDEDLCGRDLWDLMPGSDGARVREVISGGIDGDGVACSISFERRGHICETFRCHVWKTDEYVTIVAERREAESVKLREKLIEANNELIVYSRELARRTRELEHARATLEETLEELDRSYWHLKKIQEVLPICMGCGKVKTSEADWEDVLDYLQRNALFLSHGYCPECMSGVMERYGVAGEGDEDAREPV